MSSRVTAYPRGPSAPCPHTDSVAPEDARVGHEMCRICSEKRANDDTREAVR